MTFSDRQIIVIGHTLNALNVNELLYIINIVTIILETSRGVRATESRVSPSLRPPHLMPCWKTEFLLVLQMMTSAHCTTTMLTKKAVWQVNSTIFLCSYVCREQIHRAM